MIPSRGCEGSELPHYCAGIASKIAQESSKLRDLPSVRMAKYRLPKQAKPVRWWAIEFQESEPFYIAVWLRTKPFPVGVRQPSVPNLCGFDSEQTWRLVLLR